jgi:uncharacterized membrane protein YphA (DoxX/SURF4 family)
MNVVLWIAQIVLGLIFTVSGAVKAFGKKGWLLATGQTGLTHFGVPFIRFIAVSELLGATGLVTPWLTGIARFLTPVSAIGLAVVMAGAADAHTRQARENPKRRRKELANVLTNTLLLVLCLLVAFGRGSQSW